MFVFDHMITVPSAESPASTSIGVRPDSMTVVNAMLIFIVWTVSAFFAYSYAGSAFEQIDKDSSPVSAPVFLSVGLLTLFQTGVGSAVLTGVGKLLNFYNRDQPRSLSLSYSAAIIPVKLGADNANCQQGLSVPSTPNGIGRSGSAGAYVKGPPRGLRPSLSQVELPELESPPRLVPFSLQLGIAFSHMATNLMTNAAVAFVGPAAVVAIRSIEPVTTKIFAPVVGCRRYSDVEPKTVIVLPLVIFGSIGLNWRPNFDHVHVLGLCLAFGTNFAIAVRDALLRRAIDSVLDSYSLSSRLRLTAFMCFAAFILAVWLVVFQASAFPVAALALLAADGFTHFVALCLASSLAHCLFTSFATVAVDLAKKNISPLSANNRSTYRTAITVASGFVVTFWLFFANLRGHEIPLEASSFNLLFGAIYSFGMTVFLWSPLRN